MEASVDGKCQGKREGKGREQSANVPGTNIPLEARRVAGNPKCSCNNDDFKYLKVSIQDGEWINFTAVVVGEERCKKLLDEESRSCEKGQFDVRLLEWQMVIVSMPIRDLAN